MRKEYLISALISMRANILRTVLSMLWIIIGVFAVVVMLAVWEWTQASIVEQFNKMWANSITISAGSNNKDIRAIQTQSSEDVLSDDFIDYLENFSAIKNVLPNVSVSKQLIYQKNNTRWNIQWVIPEYKDIKKLELKDWRFISNDDISSFSMVVVIWQDVVDELFGSGSALGQEITFQNKRVTVVGILNEWESIFAPLSTVQYKLLGTHYYSSLELILNDAEDVSDFKTYLETDLTTYFKVNTINEAPIWIRSLSEMLDSFQQVTDMIKMLLASIAAISLLVGWIWVMNIMLVSVSERTREIGIRKAVGAKQIDILWQFLIESTLLSITAGGIWLLFSAWVVALIQSLIPAVITLSSVLIAFFSSVGIWMFFGILPARKAARLRPIDALRTE